MPPARAGHVRRAAAALGAAAAFASAPGAGTAVSAGVAGVFAPVLPLLRHARFAVLLPAAFDGVGLRRGGQTRVVAEADAHHYVVRLDLAADCNGANVCSAGSFGGYDGAYRHSHHDSDDRDSIAAHARHPTADDRAMIASGSEILDRPVGLASGAHGWYTEYRSGASDGGNSYLRWIRAGIVYAVTSRIASPAELVAIANSAIRAGAVRP